jgi:hypothetical protein
MSKLSLKQSLAAFAVVWIVLVVGPHFITSNPHLFLILSFLLFCLIYRFFSHSWIHLNLKFGLLSNIFFIYCIVVFFVIILALKDYTHPYKLFSRLGSYTMFQGKELQLFGDLIHLTSAADCEITPKIGVVLCDPWERVFNQNVDLVSFLKFMHLYDVNVLALGSLALTFWIIYKLYSIFDIQSIFLWLLLASPPFVLAIDRGNEIITVALISLAIILFKQKSSLILTSIPLFFAGIFKFWPFLILLFLTFFSIKKSRFESLLILLLSGVYLFSRAPEILKIADASQRGDLLGGSFGIQLLELNSLYSWASLFLSILVFVFLVYKFKNSPKIDFDDITLPLLFSLMSCFVLLNLFGVHFTYRLILLIPFSVLISRNTSVQFLIPLFFSILFLSRFPVITVLTNAFCFFAIYFLVTQTSKFFSAGSTTSLR